ncbi:hypothetical protein YPPY48_2587, partial [Yersinia pestis PY-48]
MVNFMRIAD